MPTYQYACTACGHQLEAVQSFTDAPLTECPACAGRLRKVFNSVGIVFKGSGFYRTDSRSAGSDTVPGGSAAPAKSESSSKSESSTGSGSTSSGSSSSSNGGSGNGSGGGSNGSGSTSKSTAGTSSSGSSGSSSSSSAA